MYHSEIQLSLLLDDLIAHYVFKAFAEIFVDLYDGVEFGLLLVDLRVHIFK